MMPGVEIRGYGQYLFGREACVLAGSDRNLYRVFSSAEEFVSFLVVYR